jgi:hypothetical protein
MYTQPHELDADDAWFEHVKGQQVQNVEDLENLPPPNITSNPLDVLHQENCERIMSGLAPAKDPVWQTMLQTVACTNECAEVDGVYELTPKDETALLNIRLWAANYLPNSSKLLMEMRQFVAHSDEQLMLFTDNIVNPTIVCYMRHAKTRLEVSMFTPLRPTEVPIAAFLRCIERVQRRTGLSDLLFCGLDAELFQHGMRDQLEQRWTLKAVEECEQLVHEWVLAQDATTIKDSGRPLDSSYEYTDLRYGFMLRSVYFACHD